MCKCDIHIYRFGFHSLNWEKNRRGVNTNMAAMTEWFQVNYTLTERYTQRSQGLPIENSAGFVLAWGDLCWDVNLQDWGVGSGLLISLSLLT